MHFAFALDDFFLTSLQIFSDVLCRKKVCLFLTYVVLGLSLAANETIMKSTGDHQPILIICVLVIFRFSKFFWLTLGHFVVTRKSWTTFWYMIKLASLNVEHNL